MSNRGILPAVSLRFADTESILAVEELASSSKSLGIVQNCWESPGGAGDARKDESGLHAGLWTMKARDVRIRIQDSLGRRPLYTFKKRLSEARSG